MCTRPSIRAPARWTSVLITCGIWASNGRRIRPKRKWNGNTDANLLSLAICKAVNLSLDVGNADSSCVAYVWLGVVAGARFGNYKAGFRFGQLGYELVERRGLRPFQVRTYLIFGSNVMPWTKHVRVGHELLRRAYEIANKIGDLTFATYSC